MPLLRELLTGRLTPDTLSQVARLLGEAGTVSSLSPADRRELDALLVGAGAWIDGWSAELRLHAAYHVD